MKRVRFGTVLAAFLGTLLLATAAYATVYIFENKGIGSTRLGWNDHTTATRLSSSYHKYVKDTRYSYTVYHWYVGKRMSNGRYPIELWSKSDHKVFQYQVNSSAYPTYGELVRVGSSESYLRSKYTNERRSVGSVYVRYRLGYRPYTDFYVSKSTHRVVKIILWR